MPKLLRTSVLLLLVSATPVLGQIPERVLEAFTPRMIGPSIMGGRIADLAVYEKDPSIFYVATASGGLLKTVNAGNTWENMFDRQATVSIGDVTINPHDPNEVWVGTGEANNRQSSSWGDGVYKSSDGGRTWTHVGLRESHHVGRIVVNPIDTDVVYVAALGHLWGPNPERGVFMTTDGGATWQHVLAIDEDTGVVDLAMDPANPKVLYAAAYPRRRSAWGFNGGGPQGGIYKTVDAGRSWRRLTEGLPEGPTGRIGLDVSRSNPDIVYAIIENREGGVFRSEDKGETWTRMNSINPRPMYFSQIRIDPNDPQRIYVCGTRLHVSDDGGRTFSEESAENVHLDHHAFWINPNNSRHVMDGNDGGVWVSRDRSESWEHLNNYPMGQFYHVAVDMAEPYNVFGGMQDNATWGGPSAVRSQQGIANEHWYQMLACDGMYVAVEPGDDIVYTNCQNGRIVRYDRRTGERKAIQPQAESDDEQLRWNWTTPIVISPHDPATLYTGANKLFRSTDRGHSWSVVSPDLTTQTDRDQLRLMGVRGDSITLARNDGMSSFGNIIALAESSLRRGLLYVGTDDGKVHVSRDGGGTWRDLTGRISGVPAMLYVSRIRPSSFDEGTVYVTFDGHRSDDFEPYVFRSTDHGESWRAITTGLPTGSVYVIEEDPKNPDLLYVGTEFGLFASLDRGARWTRWPTMPTVAVYDLKVHPRDNDLVVGTHGRSIVIFDDISPLQQLRGDALASSESRLFDARRATQFIPNEDGWFLGGRTFRAPNPVFGAYLHYYLPSDRGDSVRLAVRGPNGAAVRELKGSGTAGLHRVAWDLRAEPAGPMGSGLARAFVLTDLGPFVPPGTYSVELEDGGRRHTTTVQVDGDPYVVLTDGERRERYDMLVQLTAMQQTAEAAADRVRAVSERLERIAELVGDTGASPAAVKEAVEAADKRVAEVHQAVIGGGGFGSSGPPPVTRQVEGLKGELIRAQSPATVLQAQRFERARRELNAAVQDVNALMDETLPSLYRLLGEHGIHPTVGERLKPVGG